MAKSYQKAFNTIAKVTYYPFLLEKKVETCYSWGYALIKGKKLKEKSKPKNILYYFVIIESNSRNYSSQLS